MKTAASYDFLKDSKTGFFLSQEWREKSHCMVMGGLHSQYNYENSQNQLHQRGTHKHFY
jgi:hypothetical protein